MNGVHRRRVEAGLGQQWRVDPADVDWNYDLTARVRRSGTGVHRGRNSELERDPAGTMSCVLDGSDRALEATNSNWVLPSPYGHLAVPAGTTDADVWATAPGAPHPVSGDDVEFAFELTRSVTGVLQVVAARRVVAGGPLWQIRIEATGQLRLDANGTPIVSSAPGALPARVWYRIRTNPGAAVQKLWYDWAPGGVPYDEAVWVPISNHSPTWSPYATATSTIYLAGQPGGYAGPAGKIHRFRVAYNGVPVADFAPAGDDAGATSHVDDAGLTWAIGPDAPIVADAPTVFATSPFELGVPIRVVDETPDGDVVQFYGFATGWDPTYARARSAIDVELSAADPLSMTTTAPLPSSVLALEIAADTPKLWLRLAEQAGTVMTDLSGNDLDGTYPAGLTRSSTSSPNPYEPMPGMTFGTDGLGPATISPAFVMTLDPNNDKVEFLLQLTDEPTAVHPLIYAWSDGVTAFYIGLWDVSGLFGGASRWNLWWSEGPGTNPGAQPLSYNNHLTYSLLDKAGHHIVLDGNNLYIDGVSYSSASSSVAATVATLPALAARSTLGGSTIGETAYLLDNAVLADFAVYSTLSGVRRAAHASAFVAPWGGDTADVRADRVYDAIGWPAAARDFAACDQILAPARFDRRQKAGDHLDQVVQGVEMGRHFARRDGVLDLHDRDWLAGNVEGRDVQLDLVAHPDDEDSDHFAVATYDPKQDRSKLVNSAVGTGPTGVELIETDEPSIAQYGATDPVDLGVVPAATDADARSVLRRRVRRYRKPITSLPAVAIHVHRLRAEPVRQAAMVEKLNALDLDHRVRVSYDPMGAGDPVTLEATVESIDDWSDDISRTVTLGLSTRFATPMVPGKWGRTKWGRSVWAGHPSP